MKKTPTIFKRNPDNMRYVSGQKNPECQWVFDGEGTPTRKYDGSCCLIKDGRLFKRYELRPGKVPPDGFIAAQSPDPVTQKQPGWVPVDQKPENRWHIEAFGDGRLPDGTYELVGPKVQGNKDHVEKHILISHSDMEVLPEIGRDFDSICQFLTRLSSIEGIVWHHPDGRWAKIKRRDFGLKW